MRKSDEQGPKHFFRMGDRFFRIESKWFYTMRERDEGPFGSREEAEAHLRTFVAMQQLTEEHGARVVTQSANSRNRPGPGRPSLDTTIWDRQIDAL